MKNERNSYLDILKGFSILLVVLGHCIQYGSGSSFLEGAFFDNPIFKFIYSFHMPLFMLISGYLFAYSCKRRNWYELLIIKLKQLVIPLASWSIVSLLIAVVKVLTSGGLSGGGSEKIAAAAEVINLTWIVKTLFQSFVYGPWFLWALWWCSLTVILVRRFLRDHVLIYALGTVLTFVIPDSFNLQMYKFMWPYFLLAYLFHKYDYQNKWKKIYSKSRVAAVCGVMFIVLLCFYQYNTYIYNSGFTVLGKEILKQTGINFFRFAVGLAGSVFVMFLMVGLMKVLPDKLKRLFAYLGQNTIGVYIISGMLIADGLAVLTASLSGLNYLLVVLETVIILPVSLLLNALLKRFQVTRQLFLGGR